MSKELLKLDDFKEGEKVWVGKVTLDPGRYGKEVIEQGYVQVILDNGGIWPFVPCEIYRSKKEAKIALINQLVEMGND